MEEPVYTNFDIVDIWTAFTQGVKLANTAAEVLEHLDRVSNNMESLDLELIWRGIQEYEHTRKAFQRIE